MNTSASDKLNPALVGQLSARPDAAHPVTITFSSPQEADAVTALGLAGEGLTAYGELTRAAIDALAERPEVARIEYRPAHRAFIR